MRQLRWTCVFAAVLACPARVGADEPGSGRALFRDHVRGLLETKCLRCHGGERKRGGLDLSTREGLLKGGENGVAVVPGKSQASSLYRRAAHLDEPAMPPKTDKLSAEVLAKLAAWIDAGAAYDGVLKMPVAVKVAADENRNFWAFRLLAPVEPPAVQNSAWVRTAVDRFILAELEKKRLAPAREAERRTLIRRVTFDLIGLPPTQAEVEAFVADSAPDAYERVVERLLASPHYGERWARH